MSRLFIEGLCSHIISETTMMSMSSGSLQSFRLHLKTETLRLSFLLRVVRMPLHYSDCQWNYNMSVEGVRDCLFCPSSSDGKTQITHVKKTRLPFSPMSDGAMWRSEGSFDRSDKSNKKVW